MRERLKRYNREIEGESDRERREGERERRDGRAREIPPENYSSTSPFSPRSKNAILKAKCSLALTWSPLGFRVDQ